MIDTTKFAEVGSIRKDFNGRCAMEWTRVDYYDEDGNYEYTALVPTDNLREDDEEEEGEDE